MSAVQYICHINLLIRRTSEERGFACIARENIFSTQNLSAHIYKADNVR